MRKTVTFLCVLCLLGPAAPALGLITTWTGGGTGDSWFTTTNWTNGAPGGNDEGRMWITGGTCVIDNTGAVHKETIVGGAGTSYADAFTIVLNSSGALTTNISFKLGCATTGDGYAIFQQTGGLHNTSGFFLGSWHNDYATYEISGGTIQPSSLGYVPTAYGGIGVRVGGEETTTNRGGIFRVVGSSASISLVGGRESNKHGIQFGITGKLEAQIDAGGISTIVVDTSYSADLAYALGDDIKFFSGSTIDMDRMVGVTPEKDDSFVLLTADYIYDEGVVLSPGDEVFWSLAVVSGTATAAGEANNDENGSVTVTFKVYPGDADIDDKVNLADLQILSDNWGSGSTWGTADFNNDGNVNLADLQILSDNWGTGTVPEPATLSLLILGGLGLVRRRNRR